MSVMSKIFYQIIRHRTCKEIVHPWTDSCWEFRRQMIWSTLMGNMKFFSPVVFVPALLKLKSISQYLLIDTLLEYVTVVFGGMALTNISIFGICFFRYLFGEFKYLFFIACGASVSSFVTCFLPQNVATGFTNFAVSLAAESHIRKSNSWIISWLRKSKLTGVLCFMAMSSMILHLFKKLRNKASTFWFIRPYIDDQELSEQGRCQHKLSCQKHILDGILSYGGFGIAFEFAKYIFSNASKIKKDPVLFLIGLTKKIKAPFVLFLISYVGIYRLVHCFLVNKFHCKSEQANLISGGIAGLSYSFYPNYNFFMIAVMSLMQLLLTNFQNKELSTNAWKLTQRYSKIIPFRAIFFAFSFATLAHSRIFYPFSLSPLGRRTIDYDSGDKSLTHIVGERIAKLWLAP